MLASLFPEPLLSLRPPRSLEILFFPKGATDEETASVAPDYSCFRAADRATSNSAGNQWADLTDNWGDHDLGRRRRRLGWAQPHYYLYGANFGNDVVRGLRIYQHRSGGR